MPAGATPAAGIAQELHLELERGEGRARSSSRSTSSGGASGRALFYFMGREVARAPSREKFSLKRRAY